MDMNIEEERDLPAQGDGPPRTRRGGDTVPVPPSSSSNDGPAVGSTASPAAELAIASTSGLVEWTATTSGVSVTVSSELVRCPVIRLTRVDESEVFQFPLPPEKPESRVKQAVPFGSPPATRWAQSSSIEISDEEDAPGPSTRKRKMKSASMNRAARGDRAKRGRPPTTGEWVNLSKAKAEYVALKEREIELDEIENILDPSRLPKWTRAKQNLPTVGELRGQFANTMSPEIRKGTAPLFLFLEKLSDKSTGISGRIAHELRVNIRKLEAAIAELSDRALQDQRDFMHQRTAKDYLRKSVERLEGKLSVARTEIESLRVSSSSFSVHSPPHKKVKCSIKDVGTQIEVGEMDSLDPVNVPLPVSPALVRRETVDRGCSPVWKTDVSAIPPSTTGGLGKSGAGVSSSGNRDLTALEQSLLDHIETLFAQRDSIQEDINRIKKGLESPRRGSLPSAVEGGSRDPKALTDKKKRKKKRNGGSEEVWPLPRPLLILSHRWTPVIGRRARGMALRELTSSTGPLPHDRGKDLRNGAKDDRVTATQLAREASVTELRGNKDTRKLKPRPPTTAVVSVTIKPGVKLSYRDVMVEARSKIDLTKLGIINSRLRQSVTEGILIQIPGKDRDVKADDLANRMDAILGERGVIIGRPSKCAELRIREIDVSVSPNEVVEEIAKIGGCRKGDVQIGRIRNAPYGQDSVWVRCPALAARRKEQEDEFEGDEEEWVQGSSRILSRTFY
ncbi:cellular nucleic acid-binding protein [Lasius niger]|uniref:Cellular nucleic acid-binding protein n=1 Tax=Lasius niger TaxID=67767 RepID=A0A0J7NG13_LASNI|nr:cellular nucleic acid-binding protein [Lasius niger]